MNYKVIISIFLLNFFGAQIYAADDKKKQLESLCVSQAKLYEEIIQFNKWLNRSMRQNPLNQIDYKHALEWRRQMLLNNTLLSREIRNLEKSKQKEAALSLLGLGDSKFAKSGDKRKRAK